MPKGDITLKDIAKTVGKSVAAVSKALNDHQDISLETREAIKQVAIEMGYRPNITAQRLQKKRTDTLGLVVPILSARQADPFFTELLAGVADQAAILGYDLLVSTRKPGEDEETAYQRLVYQQRVDGLIVAQPRKNDWRVSFLTEQTVPFVIVGHFNKTLNWPSVLINTEQGISQAVEHLVSQGRQRIAVIPPPRELLVSDSYRQSFTRITAQFAGLKSKIATNIETASQKEGYRATLTLLNESDSPDGIITCHDLVGLGAMAAIQDQGFEVGNDIAVVGFGDILLAEHAQPPLTTIHQPIYSMGQQACNILTGLVEETQPLPLQQIVEPWLVVRQSSELALWL
ncbi:MAG: LacI family DNA-binding transcriptional regulator [Chloroflexota bacterium]